jgi:hypothetical protein
MGLGAPLEQSGVWLEERRRHRGRGDPEHARAPVADKGLDKAAPGAGRRLGLPPESFRLRLETDHVAQILRQ